MNVQDEETDAESGNLEKRLSETLEGLKNTNKTARKRSIEKLHVKAVKIEHSLTPEDLSVAFSVIQKPLVQCLLDSSERCREVCADVITGWLEDLADSDFLICLPALVPTVRQVLVNGDEPSEEVRLALVCLATKLCNKMKSDLIPYSDDLSSILQKTLVDPNPEIKVVSCECVSSFSCSMPVQFRMQADSLVTPLLSTLVHNYYKVRAACVRAIGDTVLQGGGGVLEKVAAHLTQRLFDQNPKVRKELCLVAEKLLIQFEDRYSYFYKILPLLLPSLEDQVPEIQTLARAGWEKAGRLWLEENKSKDKKLKDELDFSDFSPAHYPDNVVRPSLGCRTLVSRNQHLLLPGIYNDLNDWVAETRVKAAEMLYVMMIHVENDVILHMEKVLECLTVASKDDEPSVVELSRKTCWVVGHMVDPRLWAPAILRRLHETPSITDLILLGSLVSGSSRDSVQNHLEDIASVLSEPDVCQNLNDSYQEELIGCIRSVVVVSMEDCQSVTCQLFTAILTTIGLAKNQVMREKAKDVMVSLEQSTGVASKDEFYKLQMGSMLKEFKSSSLLWSMDSSDVLVFEALLCESGASVGFFTDQIILIFKNVLAEDRDAKMRLKFYIILSKMLLNLQQSLDSQGQFEQHITSILSDLLYPALSWHAGQTASAIRTAASSSLYSLFQALSQTPASSLASARMSPASSLASARMVVGRVTALLEDESDKTRIFMIKTLSVIFATCKTQLGWEHTERIYPILVKRLDDRCGQVRVETVRSTENLFLTIPSPPNQTHLTLIKTVCKALLLQMDDPEEGFRTEVLECLKKIGSRYPDCLEKITYEAKNRHQHPEPCQILIDHLQALSVN